MNAYILSQIEAHLAAAEENCTAAIIAADMARQEATKAIAHKNALLAAQHTLRSITDMGIRITDD